MSNDKKILPTLTPVPQESIAALSRNINRMGTAVVRIESAVGTIKDDLLPPVSKAAAEARDGFLKIDGRVTALEDRPMVEHSCQERERLGRQDNDIAETRTRAASISKLVWWLMGLATTIGVIAVGFVFSTKTSSTENSTKLEAQSSDILRHEREIVEIRKSQQKDRDIYLREIRALPSKVQTIAQEQPTIEAMENATDDLPLTPREQRQLIYILKAARQRKNVSKQ